MQAVELASPQWAGAARVEVVAPSGGDKPLVAGRARRGDRRPVLPPASALDASLAVSTADGLERVRGRTWVREQVAVGDWTATMRVSGSGFWQVHPGAPAALVGAVLELLDPAPGEQALDLFAGVGLFAAALAERLGPDGAVLAVEGDPHAVRDARRNLHELTQVGITAGRVDQVLATVLERGLTADLVVLDPPRDGAGRRVVEQVVAVRPRAVAYVACDPAALARDVRTFAEHGYRLDALRAFDCFPMTHHVECVARLVPTDPPSVRRRAAVGALGAAVAGGRRPREDRRVPDDVAQPAPFSWPFDVRFHEVDALGVVFNMWYLGYCDAAQAAFFAHLGIPSSELNAEGLDVLLRHADVQWVGSLGPHTSAEVRVHPVSVGQHLAGAAVRGGPGAGRADRVHGADHLRVRPGGRAGAGAGARSGCATRSSGGSPDRLEFISTSR